MVAFLTAMWGMKRKDTSGNFADGAEFASTDLFDWFFTFGTTLDADGSAVRVALENLCTSKIASGKPIGMALSDRRDRVFACGDGRLLMLAGRLVGGSQRWSIRRVSAQEEKTP